MSRKFQNEFIGAKMLLLILIINSAFETNAHSLENVSSGTSETTTKYVIFDTDMGADDAWALQLVLKAEKESKNVEVLAITIVDGNTIVENAIKNTYRILDGLNRTDVRPPSSLTIIIQLLTMDDLTFLCL